MKSLKSIIAFIILLIGGMVVGCGRGNALEPGQTDQAKVEKTDSTNTNVPNLISSEEGKAVLDSINRINDQLVELNRKVSQQEGTIKDNTRISVIVILVTLVIAIVSLIIAILAFVKVKGVIARSGRHRKEIEELKRSLSESEARYTNVARNRGSSDLRMRTGEYSDLSSRISKIEHQIELLTHSNESNRECDGLIGTHQVSSNERHGFFGLPSKRSETEAYFKHLDECRNSDTRFQVNVRNGQAEFSLLEGAQYLNEIKSNDTIQMALDLHGCTRYEATHMKVLSPGEAKSVGDRWEITKKVKIELYK